MAITWNLSKTADPAFLQSPDQWASTEAMIYATMAIGMGRWTAENLPEVALRLSMIGMLFGNRSDTLAALRPYIGLRTNAIYEPAGKWRKRIYDQRLRDYRYSAFVDARDAATEEGR